MPQESRRSTGYRPFITCDVPISVVECAKIIRNPQKIPTRKKILTQRSKKKKKLEIEAGEEHICSKEMAFGRGKAAQIQLMEFSSEEALDERVLDSSDTPSACSSQSSVVCSNKASPSLTASLKKNNRKPKCLNLMVKLMGLEGDHIRETENVVNQISPEFDLDSPMAIKHVLHCKQSDWRRTLIKIIEAVKLRGVFKSSLVKRVNYSSNLKFSCLTLKHPIIPKTRGKLDPKSEEEMHSYMRIRSNSVAQAYQKEKTTQVKVDAFDDAVKEKSEVKEANVDEKASTPGKRRRRKRLLVGKKADKVENEIRLNEEMDSNCEDQNQSCPVCEIKFASTHEVEAANDHPSDVYRVQENKNSVHHDDSMEAFHSDNKLKAFLLSSPDFVKTVEELFDVKMNPKRGLQQTANDKILLDVASETLEFFGAQYLRARLPLQWTHNVSLRTYDCTCLELVLDEVCDWIKDLQCYKKVAENDLSDESLVLLAKGDLSSQRMGIGVWDVGWRSAGSAVEFEEAAREIEELVLSGLIEEIAL